MGRPEPADHHSFAAECQQSSFTRSGRPHDAAPPHTPESVDADVTGAVVRTAQEVLAERAAEAAVCDPSFSDELARRVADFTLGGGKRMRPRLLWWGMRACGAAETTAALRLGVALELTRPAR